VGKGKKAKREIEKVREQRKRVGIEGRK